MPPVSHADRQVPPAISVVVPVFDERETLRPLHACLVAVLAGERYELIFVDDGSRDGSAAVLDELWQTDPHVRVVRFGRNFGKSAALAAGFREVRGAAVVTLDGDLQDDPNEIPRLLAGVAEGYDLISGWKADRRDPLSKVLPSRLFNWVTGRLVGLPLHDFNSGFKAYRRDLLAYLDVYGEQHRFIPALAHWQGFRVGEVRVAHHPRRHGRSKFGGRRFLAGFFDLFTVLFLTRFRFKPLHLFGTVGLAFLLAGLAINGYLTYLRIAGEQIGTRPLLQLGVLLVVTGVQFFSMGLVAEMIALGSARGRAERHPYRVLERVSDGGPVGAAGLVTEFG